MQKNVKRHVLLVSSLLAISFNSTALTSFNCEPEEYPKEMIHGPLTGDQVDLKIMPSVIKEWPDLEKPEQQVLEVTPNQIITWHFGRFSRECLTSKKCGIVFKKSFAQRTLSQSKNFTCKAEGADFKCSVKAQELFNLCAKTDQLCAFSYTINVSKGYRDPVIIIRPPQ